MASLQFLCNIQNCKAKNNIELSYSVFKLGNLFIYLFVFLWENSKHTICKSLQNALFFSLRQITSVVTEIIQDWHLQGFLLEHCYLIFGKYLQLDNQKRKFKCN